MIVYLARLREHHWRVVSFFMSWFFIVLLPTTIIPLNAIFQENRGYLAIVSFAVFAGVIISEAGQKKTHKASMVIITILIVIYSILTIQRNAIWGDEIRLWRDAIAKSPESGVGYASLSGIYRDRGDLVLSVETAKKGLSINPYNYYIHFNLGRTYLIMGEIDRAIAENEMAIKIDPERSIVWNELALLYAKKGDLERSEAYIREAVKKWGDLPPLYYNLGVILEGRGKFTEAIGIFRKAVSLYPGYFRARYELANALENAGMMKEARLEYRKIIKLGSAGLADKDLMYGQDRMMLDRIVKDARRRLLSGGKS